MRRAFLTAWRKRTASEESPCPRTWIEAIARNEARQSFVRDRVARGISIDDVSARELPRAGASNGGVGETR